MKKIVFITECLGFPGSYITQACLENGCFVYGIDEKTQINSETLKNFKKFDSFAFTENNINNLKNILDCDYFINLSSESYMDNMISQDADFLHTNINGIYNILEIIKNNIHYEFPVLIHLSSHEVYGNRNNDSHKESSLLNPISPYSATKAAADFLIQAWHHYYKLPYLIIRPTNIYGIGQQIERLIPKTCKYLRLGRKVPMHEYGSPLRKWLHVRDLASAIIFIIKSDVRNEIFNISSINEYKNIDVFKKILNIFYPEESDFNKYLDFSWTKKGRDVNFEINDTKIRDLGWSEEYQFEEELKYIVEYYHKVFVF